MRVATLLVALSTVATAINAATTPATTTTPCPTLPQPNTPCPTLPQPNTPCPTLPQPNTPCPTLPQPNTPKPSTPCPTLPQPDTPKPTTPKPTTPVPTTPVPTTPVPTTPVPTTPAPNATCDTIPNKDIFGFDLANVKGKVADCAKACKETKGCATYTWNDFNGGTCWLKSRAGTLIDKAGVIATSCKFDVPSLVCNAYKDIDFVGNDIANKPAKAHEQCCDICNTYSGCTAYAWSDHQGGTCWLKKSVGQVIAKPGVVSSSTVQLWGPVCPFEYDTDFVANDIGNKPAKDAGVCCTLCKATSACKAYSWSNYNGGTCWMKSGKGKTIAAKGVISAAIVGF